MVKKQSFVPFRTDLSFLVIAFYLIRHNRPVWFLILPMVLMLVLPSWVLLIQVFGHSGWLWQALDPATADPMGKWLLVVLGLGTMALQIWMVIEGAIMWRQARGVAAQPLPALDRSGSPVGC